MIPIPMKYLVFDVIYTPFILDTFGSKFLEPILVKNIFIEFFSKSKITNYSYARSKIVGDSLGIDNSSYPSMILYYDCVNSFPLNLNFVIHSKILYLDNTYMVHFVNVYNYLDKPHHIEIGVV
jgi:hypothetical protein